MAIVQLPDGRLINVKTAEGADIYIDLHLQNDYPFIAQYIQIHIESQRLNEDSLPLMNWYCAIGNVLAFSSKRVFAKIPEHELQAFIQHATAVFRGLARSSRWKQTGILEDHDLHLLQAVGLSMQKARFAKLAAKSDVLSAFAQLFAARESPNMPSTEVSMALFLLEGAFWETMARKADWDGERIFKSLITSGLFGQYLRVVTRPIEGDTPRHLAGLEYLAKFPNLIKKYLTKGQPTGDVLISVLAGNDGFQQQRNEAIMLRLENLAKLASLFESGTEYSEEARNKKCFRCGLDESAAGTQSLLRCGRCQTRYYCSRACQRMDWPEHQRTCVPMSEQLYDEVDFDSQYIGGFIMENYYPIMVKLVLAMQRENVEKSELCLLLDFDPSTNNGLAPALRSPPQFKIGVTRRYTEGHEVRSFIRIMFFKQSIPQHVALSAILHAFA